MKNHHSLVDNMMGQMLQPFGGSSFNRGDPFNNDPFFKEPFGQMDKMIGKMRQDMQRAMA